jgi:tetratricopeptide (TPR) repeat protein
VKSQGELLAYQAINQAATADARIKAADDFLASYADSELKPFVLLFITDLYRQKNDFPDLVIYGKRAIAADPHNFVVRVWLANAFAANTREFDLDKDQKLQQAEDYAHQAIEVIKTAPKLSPKLTDAQWDQMKADFNAQAHDAFALAAKVRKNYDAAIAEFQTAASISPAPDPVRGIQMAEVYRLAGKPDRALAEIDKALASPGLDPALKQAAENERAHALAAKPKPAAPTAAPAPAAVPPAK